MVSLAGSGLPNESFKLPAGRMTVTLPVTEDGCWKENVYVPIVAVGVKVACTKTQPPVVPQTRSITVVYTEDSTTCVPSG